MALTVTILFALSLQVIVDATEVKLVKESGNKIYVETGTQHYAMVGYHKNDDEFPIIVVMGNCHFEISPRCGKTFRELNTLSQTVLNTYNRIKEDCLKERRGSPVITKMPTESYAWSTTFSEEEKEYSVIKLDDDTSVISSKYLPSKIAKVIMSGDIIIFVYYDGQITMKRINCLASNERILLKGIKKISKTCRRSWCFPSKGEEALKAYLSSQKIDEDDLYTEQQYLRVWTDDDMKRLKQKALDYDSRGITIDFRGEFNG